MNRAARKEAITKYWEVALQVRAQVPLDRVENLVSAVSFDEGNVGWVRSHGRLRRGVVVKVGPIRATVMLTTENAIRVAKKDIAERATWDVENQCHTRRRQAEAHWDGLKELASAPDFIAENPDRATYVEQEVSKTRELLIRLKSETWEDVVRFIFALDKIEDMFTDPEEG